MRATALGLAMLAIIFVTLLWNGLGGLSLDVFTKYRAARSRRRFAQLDCWKPDHDRVGLALGAPRLHPRRHVSGQEYAQTPKLASAVRFINDILLSAPSIIVGLFVLRAVGGAGRAFLRFAAPSRSPC